MEKSFFRNKRVVVMGLGRFGGGLDSALFAVKAGANVLVTDLANEAELQDSIAELEALDIEYRLGEHREDDFRHAQVLVVNPAVPPDNKYVQIAQQAGVFITSQMELFFQMCPARIVGITGANGKSTTTALTAHLLQAGCGQKGVGYQKVWLGGNIGHQPLLDIVDEIDKNDIVVLEISNFQLDQLACIQASPYIALITNLTANHLDRHGTFESYCRTKEFIFKYQKCDSANPAVSIFNAEDSVTRAWYQRYLGENGRRCLAFCADDVPDEYIRVFGLPGRANRSNLAAAMSIVSCFQISSSRIAEAVGTFKGLPNRCQWVAEVNGVRWYDDSKATTPVSTMAALNGIDEPKILIAGGYDKQISFAELGGCIAKRAKAVVLIGQTAPKIAQAMESAGITGCMVRYADSMEQAVRVSNELAAPGDVVLMSPACASYDMFKNYIQRSEAFSRAVKELQS
ncbi:MAG: UDP-N-acetylmuramoyl-L-alanine--D-glutamate ligase [Planctomycetales bacterium]|nr:UDP-N-acetylmuramoyl-L-alanine--D-glutamate ligase [Planctomycetales bacterium]